MTSIGYRKTNNLIHVLKESFLSAVGYQSYQVLTHNVIAVSFTYYYQIGSRTHHLKLTAQKRGQLDYRLLHRIRAVTYIIKTTTSLLT